MVSAARGERCTASVVSICTHPVRAIILSMDRRMLIGHTKGILKAQVGSGAR
jgi:hypothetical protein